MRIVLNPSPYNSQVEESDLNKIEFFLLNEVEGEQISGSREPEKILSYMKRRFPEAKVVLTLGSQGAVYQDSRQKICQPAFPAPAVDTTAAGDTFTGYFIHGIACQDSVRKSLESAAKAAAIAVSRKGAADSILGRGSGSFRKFRMNLFCRNAAAPVKCHGRGGIFSLPVAKRHNLLYNA